MANPEVSKAQVEGRINEALAANARRMFYAYPVLYLVLGVQAGFFVGGWSLHWVELFLLMLFSGVRAWQGQQLGVWSPVRWRRGFLLLTLLQTLTWALPVAYIILAATGLSEATTWLIATAGIAAGGASSISPCRSYATLFIGFISAPLVLALIWLGSSDALAFAVCMVVFAVHISAMAWQQSALFHTAVRDHLQLEGYAEVLEKANRLDPLTGLYNRGYFNQQSKVEWRRAARSQQSMALLLLDIDHFKNINDRYGHLVGDRCLCLTARLLQGLARRPSDFVARFGGEEFVLLLPETDMVGAQRVARSIVKGFAKRSHLSEECAGGFEDVEHINFTVSVGVAACVPADGGHLEWLVERADSALYKAKSAGRNQWCMAEGTQHYGGSVDESS